MIPFSKIDDNKKTIYIIDGYGFIFRAFYALPKFTTNDGIPIGAVYGFFKMLISLINSARPEYMIVALDTGKRTFRNDIYDDFVEKKTLKELFLVPKYKEKFASINASFEEMISLQTSQLIEKLNIDSEIIFNVCEKFNFDKTNPPKMLVILVFLDLLNDVKVEECRTQYKANRKETPDELKSQFKIIRELIDSIGIKTESSIGFEADDVIGSIAKQAAKNGYKSVIISADKDLCQLIKDDEIFVYDPVKKKFLDERNVIEKFGVRVDQICDYLSIVGDKCDNVLGINGIGPKGAVKLLEKYEHIENILLHLNELDEKIRTKFIDNKDILELAYNLIQLRFDAIDVKDFKQYKMVINNQGLNNFIKKYGFKTLDLIQKNNHFLKNKNVKQYNSENFSKKKDIQFEKKQGNLF